MTMEARLDRMDAELAEMRRALDRILSLIEPLVAAQADAAGLDIRLRAVEKAVQADTTPLAERVARLEGRIEGVNDRIADLGAWLPAALGRTPPGPA